MVARPRDTSVDALREQRAALGRMTPNERLDSAARLSDEVKSLTESGVRRRRPTASAADVQAEVREIVLRASNRASGPNRG